MPSLMLNDLVLKPNTLPSIDWDFAGTKTLDPRLTFTRGSTATFINSQGNIETAAAGSPRFTHNPTTLASLGILLEDTRTNLVRHSQNLRLNTVGGIPTANTGFARYSTSVANPTGTLSRMGMTFEEVQYTGVNAGSAHFGTRISVTSGQTYTWSLYAVVASGTFRLKMSVTDTTTWTTATVGPEITVTTTPQRFSLTFVAPASGVVDLLLGAENKTPYSLPSTGSIFTTAWQCELNSVASSFIPTAANTETRQGDQLILAGANYLALINDEAGTLLLNTEHRGNGHIMILEQNGATSRAWRPQTNGSLLNSIRDQGGSVGDFTVSAPFIAALRVAGTYNKRTRLNQLAVNGVYSSSNSPHGVRGIVPVTLKFQHFQSTDNNHVVSRFRYWPTDLSQQRLVALTTPQ